MKTWADFGIQVNAGGHIEQKTVCPQCSPYRKKSRYPCLSINTEKGVWHCFHCAWSGTLKDGEERRSNPRATPITFRKPVYRQTPLPSRVIDWFARRGIPESVLARNRISYGLIYMPQLEQEVPAIQFPYFRHGEVVNVKYRDGHKYFRMEGGAERVLYGLDDIQGDTLLMCEGECFPGHIEVLTDAGWCRFDQYHGERVAQYDDDGSLRMVMPTAVVQKEFSGELVRHCNTQRFVSCTTPHHQMVALDSRQRLRKHDAQAPLSSADTIPRVGILDGPGVPLSEDEIALCLAVSADASIRTVGYRRPYAVFGFKKTRKICRLRSLLQRLDLPCSDTQIAGGYTSICLPLPSWCIHRDLPAEWLTQLSAQQRKFILDEMVQWDGNRVPNRQQTEFSTKWEHNAIWMQTLAHTTGMVSTIIPRHNAFGSWFKVSVLHIKQTTSWQSMQTEHVPYTGKVYCVQVPSGMILTRQEGCISISGNCDKLSLEVAGYSSCVSVPDGAPAVSTKNYESKFDFLLSAEAVLKPLSKIVLAVDSDSPGQKLAEELARRLGPERCYRVSWASDCKDANDVLVSHGVEVLRECIEAAQPWPVHGIITVDMLSNAIDYIYEHGMERGVSPGWGSLAQHYTVRPGEVTIVTGIPSHGKSTLINAMMIELARHYQWRSAVFSPENYPLERFSAMLLEQYTGLPFDGAPGRMDRHVLAQAKAWLTDYISFLMPEEEVPTVAHLLDLARIQVYRQGIKGLVLDPWNEIEHSIPAGQTETQYISQSLSAIRRFARLHRVHVWVIAHPTKLHKAEKGEYAGQYPPPSPYDISGGAHWRNKADVCLCVWRHVEADDNRIEVHIQKIRFREIGKPGKVDLIYEPDCGRFHEPPIEEARWTA